MGTVSRWLVVAVVTGLFALFSPTEFGGLTQCSPQRVSAHHVPCCKYCSRGKACGNTCIARNKTCRVGHGCACDAMMRPGHRIQAFNRNPLYE